VYVYVCVCVCVCVYIYIYVNVLPNSFVFHPGHSLSYVQKGRQSVTLMNSVPLCLCAYKSYTLCNLYKCKVILITRGVQKVLPPYLYICTQTRY